MVWEKFAWISNCRYCWYIYSSPLSKAIDWPRSSLLCFGNLVIYLWLNLEVMAETFMLCTLGSLY